MQNLPNLPKAWEFRTLGDCLDYEQPQKYIVNSTKYNDSYKIPVLTAGKGFILGYTNETQGIFTKTPVIIFDDFTTDTKFVDFPFKVKSSAMKILHPKSNADIKFMYYLMQSITIRHDTHKRYWISIYAKVKIPLPPIDEQKRIVKIIDEKFAKIDKGLDLLLENKELLRKYKLSLLKSAFDGKLVSNSKNWEIKTLGEVFLIERGGSPRPIKSFLTKEANGINWIKIGDASNSSKYIYQTAEKIKPEGKKRSRFVEIGDLILSNSMSFGRPYIMKTTGCIHDGWVVLRNSKKMIDEEFAYYVLTSSQIYAEFSKLAAGSTVKNLSIDRIKQVKIPLPPIDEQKRIVKIIDAKFKVAEALEKLNDENIQNFKLLKKAILKDAFKSGLKG